MLYPYQQDGIEWLSKKRFAILADEMGLGKTIQAIRAADNLHARRLLIICPAVARINWQRECDRFSCTKRQFTIITSRKQELPKDHSVIISYDLATKVPHGPFDTFDLCIIDEAHYLKSYEAQRTRAILGVKGLARRANRIWALSGTIMPNHAGELWPWLVTFGRTKMSYKTFTSTYCAFAEGQGPESQYPRIIGTRKDAFYDLKLLLEPILLRRKKEQVLKELPKLSSESVVIERGKVELPPSIKTKIHDELQKIQGELFQAQDDEQRLRILEAVAPSVSSLRRYLALQKIDGVLEYAENHLMSKDKLVIFALHTDVIKILKEKLVAYHPAVVIGETSPEGRQMAIDSFQSNPLCRVFLGNIMAAGTAITLAVCHTVFFLEQQWSPAYNEQAWNRCHRIGQTHPVLVKVFSVADSIDEKINGILRRKNNEIAQLFH